MNKDKTMKNKKSNEKNENILILIIDPLGPLYIDHGRTTTIGAIYLKQTKQNILFLSVFKLSRFFQTEKSGMFLHSYY